RAVEVAGRAFAATLPRLSYREALRCYCADKPGRRLPPFICVECLLPSLTRDGLPLAAIRIPKTGALSRSERDALKVFGKERGLRVFDDLKRLERDFPGPAAEIRVRTGASEEDLVLVAGWAGEPKGHRPAGT